MDARIQQSVVANLSGRPAPITVGPFVIGVDPGTDSPGINYATPIPGSPITATDVTALIAAFRSAKRKPRLEYVTSTAPDLEALLLGAGFTVEERHEYLICTPATLTVPPTPDGFELLAPSTDEQRIAMVSAQHAAFGGDTAATTADATRMARLQSRGGIALMAVATADAATTSSGFTGSDGSGSLGAGSDGAGSLGDARMTVGGSNMDVFAVAGGGQAVPPSDGVSEVAGIAVREAYRRRGLAGAITADITSRLFAAGAELAWLEASGVESWRVYERIGYRPAGKRLYIAME
ncbi:GNAT family N-acetyltransferase [Actinoplanes sp. N902-109]|uniref:GNAT family N-acetyltransferase n=1 Tax=Actinoplanes sp. (strain N902-109) TaxID=649831 RepID=UPI0003A1B33D|nr:GNAT family N-acetyltransferase [Actinoplanes sp. N902-109]